MSTFTKHKAGKYGMVNNREGQLVDVVSCTICRQKFSLKDLYYVKENFIDIQNVTNDNYIWLRYKLDVLKDEEEDVHVPMLGVLVCASSACFNMLILSADKYREVVI